MKVVCVGSYCAGALVCDLLNGVRSPFETNVIKSRWNHILKESDDSRFLHLVLPEHQDEWITKTEKLIKKDWTNGLAFACHQPPTLIPNLDIFEEIINITLTTMNSRWLRFLRHYYIEINGQKMMQDHSMTDIRGMINIIKHDPSWLPIEGVTNVEFEDIVSGKWCEEIGGDTEHMRIWQKKNKFIVDEDQDPKLVELWNTLEYYYMDPELEINGRQVEFFQKSIPPHWEKHAVERINKTQNKIG